MAGHYGSERVTVRNMRLVKVDLENNLLLIRGAVPGPIGAYVTIRKTNKLSGKQAAPAIQAAPAKKK
jgi:large subunit ribosomal protein L3